MLHKQNLKVVAEYHPVISAGLHYGVPFHQVVAMESQEIKMSMELGNKCT